MSAVLVQQAYVASSDRNPTFAITATAGDLLVICACVDPVDFYTVNSVTGGGTWFKADGAAGNNNSAEIWYCPNNTGGAITVSVTYNGYSNQGRETTFSEWSSVKTATVLDVHSAVNNHDVMNPRAAAITPTGSCVIIAACSSRYNGQFTGDPDNSFTAFGNSGIGDIRNAYRIVPTPSGSYDTGCTTAGNATTCFVLVAFLAAAPAGGLLLLAGLDGGMMDYRGGLRG
jgi:hypothetical protein